MFSAKDMLGNKGLPLNKAQIRQKIAVFLDGTCISDIAYYMDESASRQIALNVTGQPIAS
jgi:hypothetical protein